MRVVVNIRGCNGAGKSTVPLQMLENDLESWIWEIKGSDGKRITAFTVFPNFGWVALGTYLTKTGGLDTISNKELIRQCLFAALDAFPEYNILMEGILCSTTYSSYAELFKEVEKRYQDTKVIILSLMPPIEVAISRVYERNGGKPIKEDLIEGKWLSVYRSHQKFKAAGFSTVRVDSSKVSKSKMLDAFLKTVSKYSRRW